MIAQKRLCGNNRHLGLTAFRIAMEIVEALCNRG